MYEIKKEELKELAEWLYEDKEMIIAIIHDNYLVLNLHQGDFEVNFRPHRSSSQLDRLKKKMIKELTEKYEGQISWLQLHKPDGECSVIIYHTVIFDTEILLPYGCSGKNELDAILNTLIKYVRSINKEK